MNTPIPIQVRSILSNCESENLILDSLNTSDWQFIYDLTRSEGWLKYIGSRNITSEVTARDYIQKIKNNPDCNFLVFKPKSTQKPIGLVTLIKRDYLTEVDLGFAILPEFAGQGFTFEACVQVLVELKKLQSFQNIEAITIPSNRKSTHLLERLGFRFKTEILEKSEKLFVFEKRLFE